MSLNDSHMLPERVRNMRQMNDLLNAEDAILAAIEMIIDEAYQRAALLHEELVNEAWLKEKLESRTEAGVEVLSDAEKLLASFILNVTDAGFVDMDSIRKFIDKWLPAHLMFKITLLMEYGFLSPEVFSVTEMGVGIESQFWHCRTLDGSWLLDGCFNLDSLQKPDEYGLIYEMGELEIWEEYQISLRMAMKTFLQEEMKMPRVSLGFESIFWKGKTLNGSWLLNGSLEMGELKQAQEYGLRHDCGSVGISETVPGGLVTVRDMWLLDGSYMLNGRKKIDAERREEDLR